jgi:hypothetical protein
VTAASSGFGQRVGSTNTTMQQHRSAGVHRSTGRGGQEDVLGHTYAHIPLAHTTTSPRAQAG